jgi:hypothetical protein
VDRNPAAPWGRVVVPPGAPQCTVSVGWSGVRYPAIVDPQWTTTGSMVMPRAYHTAGVLADGRVLLAGGTTRATLLPIGGIIVYSAIPEAELYDPATETFAVTGSLKVGRMRHTASVLPSGKVLLAGGSSEYETVVFASAEIFDPATGTFRLVPSPMANARVSHTATVLPGGKTLIAGGRNTTDGFLAKAELFDPAANGGAGGFITVASPMSARRRDHSASVLPSGKVLIAGGEASDGGTVSFVSGAEIFDPAAPAGAEFVATGSMLLPRAEHSASPLLSGKVLIAGGHDRDVLLEEAETFDPQADGGKGAFTKTGPMVTARYSHTASVLPSGEVILVGGVDAAVASANPDSGRVDLYAPGGNLGKGTFADKESLVVARAGHTASVLPSEKLLIAGGTHEGVPQASAELAAGRRGEGCTTSAYCLTGHCANGVCCDSACDTGPCDRCDLPGAEGYCNVAPLGHPGGCAPPYLCNGTASSCPSSCTEDAGCAKDSFCAANGTCAPRKPQGAACDARSDCKDSPCRDCATGQCVDGFCCDAACGGTCEACADALKQEATGNGVCGPIRDNTDPRSECAASAEVCGASGMCNGARGCARFTPPGVACGSGGQICDGSGACVTAVCDGDHTTRGTDGKPVDCAPYKCDSIGTCRNECRSVADCVAPTVCTASGQCVVPVADGEEGGGCSVAPAAGGGAPLAGWALGFTLLASCRRRRRVSAARA